MLQNVQHIRSRETINRQLEMKYEDVLEKFCQELSEVQLIFHRHKDDPPHAIHMPPVAGPVKWARSLFHRVKATVLSFKQRPSLLQSPSDQDASARYLEVAREIRTYEKTLHKEWCLRAEQQLPLELSMNVLKFIGERRVLPTVPSKQRRISSCKKHESKVEVMILTSASRFQVNYTAELRNLIAEAKYLDIFELEVPEALVNITLQDKHQQLRHELRMLTDRLESTLSRMTAPVEALLERHVLDLAASIQPGVQRLNWNSLGVGDYIERCLQALSKFESVLVPVLVR